MYSEDAYCLGLLYAHIYADKKMVLKDDLDKFHKIIVHFFAPIPLLFSCKIFFF